MNEIGIIVATPFALFGIYIYLRLKIGFIKMCLNNKKKVKT